MTRKCTIRICDKPARWLVTLVGHPNVPQGAIQDVAYCHPHAEERASLLWDESPTPYTVTITGPYPEGCPA